MVTTSVRQWESIMHACADRQPIKKRGHEQAAFPTKKLLLVIRPLRIGISADRLTNKYFTTKNKSFLFEEIDLSKIYPSTLVSISNFKYFKRSKEMERIVSSVWIGEMEGVCFSERERKRERERERERGRI